jgi:2-polyprenyl-3-methyl-5-hydroxy-6-metoxy-1,4-benzoquinol methylase
MSVCWCGNSELIPFSSGYEKCNVCEALVASMMPDPGISHVINDEQDFYGRKYWFLHQEEDLGHPDIKTRSRTDLPERCLHWLRCLLKYRLPPASALEIGSAHGGFVALLRWAGFDACGLELSPWVVDFARRTFDVPMFLGPLEKQTIKEGSFDVIVLMDVLEHLPHPVSTMRHCLNLLTPTGILIIQTPRYPEGKTYAEMIAQEDPFLKMLKDTGHLYLFSIRSIRQFFHRLGINHFVFEPAIFSQYDMFLIGSRMPLVPYTPEDIERSLTVTSSGRMVQALLDLGRQIDVLEKNRSKLEADRAARLEVIERQAREFGEKMAEIEADRAARLEVINKQGQVIGELEAELAKLRSSRSWRMTEPFRRMHHRWQSIIKGSSDDR